MPANKPDDLGDVHAPVEDTDVPSTLKVMVILMLIIMAGLAVLIGFIIAQPGLFNG